jgi:hypothetical protein
MKRPKETNNDGQVLRFIVAILLGCSFAGVFLYAALHN